MSVVVKYDDTAIGAKQDFEIETDASLPNSDASLFKQEMEAERWGGYTIPFELNSFVLDGNSKFLPDYGGIAKISFISEEISDSNGDFEYPIQFVLTADDTYVSSGLTIVFDEVKNIYATRLNIEWYNDNVLLASEEFYPKNANYFCGKKVEFYNKVIITFYSLNLPYHRLRVNLIEHGIKVDFRANELRSAKIIQEIDPISTSVPTNTFDFTIDSKKDIEFSFQTRQPIQCLFNDELKAITFVKSAKRKSKTIWDIKSEDYIGIMDTIYFKGGIYTNKNAFDLLGEIFAVAKVPFDISDEVEEIYLTGYIPYTTCREALMQVIFAMGVVADTSGSWSVNIFPLDENVSQDIPRRRIFQGQNFEDETRVTAVELTSHSYNEISETFIAYEAEKSGEGDGIFVVFSEPLHDLTIVNGSIIENGVNYAVINASSGCVLSGEKYEHTMVIHRKDNPFILSTDIENIVAIEDATLVSSNNIDKLLPLCYNYLVNTERANMKIVDGKNDKKTSIGDIITYETEYLGNKQGRIIKQSFALSGGILIKDSVVR